MNATRYSYEECIEISERVAWKLEDVLGDATFDLGRRFLPEGLAQVNGIEALAPAERLKLNQIRGMTYAHLFGFVEEYIIRKVQETTAGYGGPEMTPKRALARFLEEELKHQMLFEATKAALQEQLGTCDLVPGAAEVAGAILGKSDLGIWLLTAMLEWLSQQHYTEIFRSSEEREALDPTFVRLFKSHWLEEAQHAKLDTLELMRAAERASASDRARAVDEVLELGGAFDGLLRNQAELDVTSLERLCGRTLGAAERGEVLEKQHRAYRYTFLVSGLTHPTVVETVRNLAGAEGVEKFAAAAAALSG